MTIKKEILNILKEQNNCEDALTKDALAIAVETRIIKTYGKVLSKIINERIDKAINEKLGGK